LKRHWNEKELKKCCVIMREEKMSVNHKELLLDTVHNYGEIALLALKGLSPAHSLFHIVKGSKKWHQF
jgi:hypothetical protein